MNKAQLIQDIRNNVYTNKQKLIKGKTVGDRLENIVNNALLYDEDILTGKYSKNLFVTVSQLLSLASSSGLIPQAFYTITDSEYGSLIRTQANSTSTLYPLAFDIETGSSGTYNQSTDTFSPWAQSGEFESTLTVTSGASATLVGKLLYHKIGNIVSISGTIDLDSVDNNKIVPSLPFAQDTTKPLNFTCTLSNGLQYNELRSTTSFNLGVLADPANDNKLTILLRSGDTAANYTIFFSGHYVCV
jgi:hypothetical protein